MFYYTLNNVQISSFFSIFNVLMVFPAWFLHTSKREHILFQKENYAERIIMVRKIRNVQTFGKNTGTERYLDTFVKTGKKGSLRTTCNTKKIM